MTIKRLKVMVAGEKTPCLQALLKILSEDQDFEVTRCAPAELEIVRTVRKHKPCVILLAAPCGRRALPDLVSEIMIETPTPTLIICEASENSDAALKALKSGALCILRIPADEIAGRQAQLEREFRTNIKSMAQVKLVRRWRAKEKRTAHHNSSLTGENAKIVAIAASTGGPAALQNILGRLPTTLTVPILVVQHIAPGFVESVVSWLNDSIALPVCIARNGELLRPGTVYFAPDDHHLGVGRTGAIALSRAAPIGGFRPAADHLFESVAKVFNGGTLAVILTGMGQDGFKGLQMVKAHGGRVIAQDETSCVVFGMPRVAIEEGIADRILSPLEISDAVLSLAMEPKND